MRQIRALKGQFTRASWGLCGTVDRPHAIYEDEYSRLIGSCCAHRSGGLRCQIIH
jgi:hypothetical protein